MTDLQQKMLDLLLEIDSICRSHGIEYYMAGGSVLGAVRHRGFIPWDDDIDIMMTRENFSRFEDVCSKELAPDREVITTENTPCHTKVTIKYMDKNTSQFFRSQVLDTTACGISLDIFILDPLPADEAEKNIHIAHYVVYNELLTPFFMVNPYFYQYVPLYREYERKIEEEGRAAVMSELYHRLFVHDPVASNQYLYRWGQQLLIYDRSLFGTPRDMLFEGHMLPVPENTIGFLRATYGDTWKYLPDEQQRETHVSFFNPRIPYYNWLRDLKSEFNREKVLSDFVKRKELNVQKAQLTHEISMTKYRLAAFQMECEIRASARMQEAELASLSMVERKRILEPYYNFQLKSELIKNGILVRMPDSWMELALQPLVQTGAYLKAEKIWKLCVANNAEMSEDLKKIGKQISTIHCFVRGIEDGRVKEITQLLIEFQKQYPEQLEAIKARLYIEIRNGMGEFSDRAQCMSFLIAAMEKYPEDRELAYLAGCIYADQGNVQKAEVLFDYAKKTNNGLILIKLQDMMKEQRRNEGV